MNKRGIFILMVLGFFVFFSVDNVNACAGNNYPCLIFDQGDYNALRDKVGLGTGTSVPESVQAYSAMPTSCTFIGNNPNPGNNDAYHACAIKCWLGGTSCSSAKTAFMAEISFGLPGNFGTQAQKMLRLALAYDYLMAAGQLSATERVSATHRLQDWLDWSEGFAFGGGQKINQRTSADTNIAYQLVAGRALIALLLKDNPDALTGAYYNTPTQIENLIIKTRDQLVLGNKDAYDLGGQYTEGYRYTLYGPNDIAIKAIIALDRNGYGNEVSMLGNAIEFPIWSGYSLLGDSEFSLFADTDPLDTKGWRIGFNMYKVIDDLWNQGRQEEAKFALSKLNHIFVDNLNSGALSSFFHVTNPYWGRAFWYPNQIDLTGYDPDNEMKPSKFFRDTKQGDDLRGNFIQGQSELPGTGGTYIGHNILTGNNIASIFYTVQGEFSLHRPPDDGAIQVGMKDSSGYKLLISEPGYVVQNGWIGANSTDHNIVYRSGDSTLSGNHFNYRSYNGTLKSKIIGWDNDYVRSTHNYVWNMADEGSRMVAYVKDMNNPIAFILDEADDNLADTYNQGWNTEVQATDGAGFMQIVSGNKKVRMNYYYPASNFLTFNTPNSAVQVAQNHNAYKNIVSQTTWGSNPDNSWNARFFYSMRFEFSGSAVPSETTLIINGGSGVKLVWPNGDFDYVFARFKDYNQMDYSSAGFTLNPTDAKFVFVRMNSGNTIQKVLIAESSGVGVSISGNAVSLLDVPTGVKVNIGMNRGLQISQNNPFTTSAISIPDMNVYIPGSNVLVVPNSAEEVLWNDVQLSSNQYSVLSNSVQIGQVVAQCSVGQTQLCSNQIGVCLNAVETCSNGNYLGCGNQEYLSNNANYQSGSENSVLDLCGDTFDNDCDGTVDCSDSDCSGSSFCSAPAPPTNLQAGTGGGGSGGGGRSSGTGNVVSGNVIQEVNESEGKDTDGNVINDIEELEQNISLDNESVKKSKGLTGFSINLGDGRSINLVNLAILGYAIILFVVAFIYYRFVKKNKQKNDIIKIKKKYG